MFSVCFYWCISCSVIISYLLTAGFDARLMHLNKSVIHSFIHSWLWRCSSHPISPRRN